MVIWSLLKTWWANPGYVDDYFKSVVVKETVDSETINQNQDQVARFINASVVPDSSQAPTWKSEQITRILNVYNL